MAQTMASPDARRSLVAALGAAALTLSALFAAGPLAARELALPPGADKAAEQIDRASLEAPIRFLADDQLEGRLPASRGDELARLYLESSLRFLGFAPGAADGSYQQPFDLVGLTSEMPPTWEFQVGGKAFSWKKWDEYIAATGVQRESSSIQNAEVVFVGYGMVAPEYQWDDFKGMDLKGKVLLVLNNDPDWDPNLFAGTARLYYGRWDYKYASAARQGAAGAIIVHTTPSAGYGWQVIQSSWTGEQFELPAGGEPRLQVAAWGSEDAVRRLVQAAGKDWNQLLESAKKRDFRPVPLGIRTSLKLANKIVKTRSGNVIGVLPGSDPALADQAVIFTAHHDHLGVGEPDKTGDKVYNGALDNASGCGQVLAIAKAVAALPERPKRSIVFLFVGGEEQGLLGSKYYAAHPTFPPGKIAANINYDGANIWGKAKDVAFIGLGKSSLDAVVTELAARQGRKVVGDPKPDKGHYYRSDQFSFAQIGVPAIYIDTGTDFVGKPAGWGEKAVQDWEDAHYHQASDNFDGSWSFDGILDDARLGFYAGLAIAQQPEMPTWKPGDEFEAARKKALSEVR